MRTKCIRTQKQHTCPWRPKMPPCPFDSICSPTFFNALLALHIAVWVNFFLHIFFHSHCLFFYGFTLKQNKSIALGQEHKRHHLTNPPHLPLLPLPSLLQDWQIDRRTVLSFFASHLSNLPASILPGRVQCGCSILRQGKCSPELTISPRLPECPQSHCAQSQGS